MAGRLYLVPNLLGVVAPQDVLPARTIEVVRGLRHFVAENAKTARAFLKSIDTPAPLQQIDIAELNEHTPPNRVAELLGPLSTGNDLGLLSDAGCPAIADPGGALVAAAHRAGIAVVPLVGPSSILLALMASGLNGQGFTFHGYLPTKPEPRTAALRHVDALARSGATQIFIEAPYRNITMLQAIVATCAGETLLTVAADLTLPTEEIVMLPVNAWRQRDAARYKNRPAIFLLGRAPQR